MSKGIWSTVDVPTMWVSAQAADTQMAWEQVGAWSRTHELLLFHESRLKTLQLELLAAWPPERSPAANAFVQHMEGLLTRVAHARHDAAKNRDALKLLLESLASARNDMAPIKRAWDEFEAQESTSPHFHKGQSWQEALNAKAQSRMERNDREVFEATQAMVVPGPGRFQSDKWEEFNNSIQAGSIHDREEPLSSTAGASDVTTGGHSKAPVGDDTQLAGTAVEIPSSSSGLPSATATTWPNGVEESGGRLPQPLAPSPRGVTGFGSTRHPVVGSHRVPGGNAGARPPSTSNATTVSTALGVGSQRTGARINPVGGVISPTSTGVAGVPLTRAGGVARSDERTTAPIPMLQWEVASGGAPVIEPLVERSFELGPGVIGIDR